MIKQLNQNSNFWMFHRVSFANDDIDNNIADIYKQRGMLHTYDEIITLIDLAYSEGYKFGSIKQALKNKNIIHLSFDDGYKEHLMVAEKLKNKYNFLWEDITFSINIRNSFYNKKFSMDLIYKLYDEGRLADLSKILPKKITNTMSGIKGEIFSSKKYIAALNTLNIDLKKCFLNADEVLSLAKLFSIASHCVNHCYLTSLTEKNILYELNKSKQFLEYKLNVKITTICYPDGKNNHKIQMLSKKCGYKYGLSISHNECNYQIGRKIPRLT